MLNETALLPNLIATLGDTLDFGSFIIHGMLSFELFALESTTALNGVMLSSTQEFSVTLLDIDVSNNTIVVGSTFTLTVGTWLHSFTVQNLVQDLTGLTVAAIAWTGRSTV